MTTPWHTDYPDADITVLMRLDSDEYPISIGYWDGMVWQNCDTWQFQQSKVLGWMRLEDAAKALDK